MKIKKQVVESIIDHAKKDAPIEACGYLAALNGVVIKHYELPNIDKSTEHFSFEPKDQFAVIKDIRENNLELSAVYHSHPVTPARPSLEDIKLAYDPDISYVIVSLAAKEAKLESYKIKNSNVALEGLEVV